MKTGIFYKIEKPGTHGTNSLNISQKLSSFKPSIFYVCFLGKWYSHHCSGYDKTLFSLSWRNPLKWKKYFSFSNPILLKKLNFGARKSVNFQNYLLLSAQSNTFLEVIKYKTKPLQWGKMEGKMQNKINS